MKGTGKMSAMNSTDMFELDAEAIDFVHGGTKAGADQLYLAGLGIAVGGILTSEAGVGIPAALAGFAMMDIALKNGANPFA